MRNEHLESLLVEWHFRRGQGEDPSVEELCRHAPELCAELQMEIDRQQRFLDTYAPSELTRLVRSVQSGPTTQLVNPDQQFLGNRFRLLSQLGQGSTGVVYRAYDLERKRQVAIKQPRVIHPAAIYRLKREFRSLEDLVHPNLVKLYELFEDDGICFYTMELVEGVNFLDYVRPPQQRVQGSPTTQLNLDRLRAVLTQLAKGVGALHDAGKLHRDIKPSNVLVTQEGRVVLLDFGLARNVGRSRLEYRTETAIAGTIGYMSPEQGAGRALTEASDWYSVGAMLYEALTGRLAFQGNHREILSQKQMLEPPPPAEITADIPEDLNNLCVALLQSRAEDRPTGEEISCQVCPPTCGTPHEAPMPVRKPAEDVPLVGRDRELATLSAAFEASLKGVPVIVRVRGQSGVGKTALMRQFLAGLMDSAVLLADLVSPPDPAPLFLIVSYRSEDANSQCLRTLNDALDSRDSVVESSELHIKPLHSDLAKELALAWLQSVRAPSSKSTINLNETATAIARESAGNPWLIELASSLVDETYSATSNGSIFLDDTFRQRVARLPEAARSLLEVICVAGRPLFQADAFQAAGLGAEGQDALEHLRSARSRLLRTTGLNRDKLDTYHDRVRETVLRYLPPENRREYHRRIASVLESSSQADPEALATHWQGAGEHVRAGENAARAAARAEDALAFDQAATLYQFAIKLLPSNLVAEHDLGTKLARALANAGRGVEAADAYSAASVGMPRGEQIDRQSCAAAQLIRSGHIDQGLVVLRGVLSDIGFKLAKTPGRALWLAIVYRIRLRLRGLHFREVADSEIHPDELRRIDMCWSVSTALGMIDNIRGADFSARNLLLALRAGEPYRIARALTIEIAYSAGTSWGRRRATSLLETAEALGRRLDHPHALGMVTLAKGVSRFLAGDWPRAQEFCDLAEDTFRDHCTGVAWELDTARTISLWSLFFTGNVIQLKSRLPNLIREAPVSRG